LFQTVCRSDGLRKVNLGIPHSRTYDFLYMILMYYRPVQIVHLPALLGDDIPSKWICKDVMLDGLSRDSVHLASGHSQSKP
jgi:hypothetical protein